jgi:site-specific DNA-methyltransferase (adenine-specific)
LATECGNKNHSAVFPEALPSWFVKLFTQEGDWVLDPFLGSGTTCKAAEKLLKNSIGIELQENYYEIALKDIDPMKFALFKKAKENEKYRY